jgi:hypothetical protein
MCDSQPFYARLAAEHENNRGDLRALIISTFVNYH